VLTLLSVPAALVGNKYVHVFLYFSMYGCEYFSFISAERRVKMVSTFKLSLAEA
jgi:hypothetical protein